MEAVAASTAPAKPTVLRVAAFCGSLRKDSWHRGLIRAGTRGAVRGVHPGTAHRPRRHLRPAHGQPGPGDRRRRRLPAGGRGVPRQGPRRRLLPLRLARVQLLHHRHAEERAGLGVEGEEELLGGQGGGDRLRGGQLRRGQGGVPPPAGRGVPGPALHQQAGAPRQGVRGPAQVRRRRQPHPRRDQGAAQAGAPLAPGLRSQAPTQGGGLKKKQRLAPDVRVLISLHFLRTVFVHHRLCSD